MKYTILNIRNADGNVIQVCSSSIIFLIFTSDRIFSKCLIRDVLLLFYIILYG